MFLLIGTVIFFAAILPYIIYLAGIFFGRKLSPCPFPASWPAISIIISAYNEESVVADRIANLASCRYPKEFYEVIFVDDLSCDRTLERARMALENAGIRHTIIGNTERLGTSRSYNNAMRYARNTIILTTDADVFFEPDAVNFMIARLVSDPKIAAVTGELKPRMNESSTTKLEGAYRSFYGRMCDWESSIDSTYNFNGAIVAFRSDLIRRIDDKRGADDANTAFEAIRKGFRAVYEMQAVVYEDIPERFGVQYRQKIRRAKQLIDATLANLDLLHQDRPFSRFVYPLRIYLYLFTPAMFFLSLFLLAAGIFLVSPLLLAGFAVLGLIISFVLRDNLLVAFAVNQFYLLMGLLHLGKDMRVWESTSKKGTK